MGTLVIIVTDVRASRRLSDVAALRGEGHC
jgi:hypothetical protein